MTNELITIEATRRTKTGKGHNRKLRLTGKIPGVLLKNGKAESLELDPKWLSKAYKECGNKFNLVLDGETKLVYVKDVQLDHVRRQPLHVDLMYVE
jgi:large subunit ribosomal protein L25